MPHHEPPDLPLPDPDDEIAAQLDAISRGPIPPADPRYVRFYLRPKRDAEKSKASGTPIHRQVEYVEILTAGDKDNVSDRPVRRLDRYVWKDKYVAFRNGTKTSAGVPLSVWGGVDDARVADLAALRIHTVEELADVSDNNLQRLGMHARSEREKARKYLEVMRDDAPIKALRTENEEMKARLAALEALANASAPEGVPVPPPSNVKPEKRAK